MKTLLMVDIQKKYNKNFEDEYIKNVINYLEKNHKNYDKIILIMENNKMLGDYINNNMKNKLTIKPIFKCYDEDYSLVKLKNSKNFKITKEGLKPLIDIPYGSFFIKEDNGYIVGTKNEKQINMDYMNKDLYLLFNYIRNSNIYIIGGGLNHCVRKTKNYLKFMNIESKILEDLCYQIYPKKNPCDELLFDVFVDNKQKD